MKKLTILIVGLVALIALVGLVLTLSNGLTGKWYQYSAQYGPLGQVPTAWNNKNFIPIVEQPKIQSSFSVCCDYARLAENGYSTCPTTKEETKKVCGIPLEQQEDESWYGQPREYFQRPCLRNQRECQMPVS